MTGKPDGGTPPQAGTRCDDMGLKGSAHWVSLRMSGAPQPRVANVEADGLPAGAQANDDLIAEIEALRSELISAARAERAGAAVACASPHAAPPDEHRVPNLPAVIVPSHVDVPERATFGRFVGWSSMAFAAVAIVAVLMLREMPRMPSPEDDAAARQEDRTHAALLRAGERLPHFASFATGVQPEQIAGPSAPGIVVATGPVSAGVLADADPLETVTMHGLPQGVRLTVGQRISATDWAIARADLDEVRLVVPYDQEGPVRAHLAFASRSGVVLARMGLAIEHEAAPVLLAAVEGAAGTAAPVAAADALAPVGVAPALAMSAPAPVAVAPARVTAHDIPVTMLSAPASESDAEAAPVTEVDALAPAGDAPTLAVSAWAPAAMAPAPFAAYEIPVTTLPEPPHERKAKALSRRPEKVRARAATPRAAASLSQPAMRPPRGLFPLEPAKISKPEKAAAEVAAKAKTEPAALSGATPAAAAKPSAAPKPKQKSAPAALPTGYQIQSTLGGGFTVATP